jgi:glycosyltransferase involved in cell wall biosynthesis
LPSVGSFLHSTWRLLPRDLRRGALYGALDLTAPRASSAASLKPGPLIVGGQLTTASGLGESARLCLTALRDLGWNAGHADVSRFFLRSDLPSALPGPQAEPGEGGTLILHVNGPYMRYVAARLGRRFLAGRRIIGYWAWELPIMGADWRRGLTQVHEIWVPSRFNAAALPKDTKVPVRVVPHPVRRRGAGRNRARFGLPEDAFVVLTAFDMGSAYARKNPRAAIAAFRQAFGDDPNCQMVLKVSHAADAGWAMADLMQALTGAGNIRLFEDTLTGDDMAALVASADTVLSLHRAEGFGLLPAEAMLHEVPVVATNWSGNTDFMTADDSALVSYHLVPASDPQGTYDLPGAEWADPSTEEAAAWLRRLRGDPELRRRMGQRARENATSKLSLDAYRHAIGDSLPSP